MDISHHTERLTAIYWNIWKEKHSRIFNSTVNSLDIYLQLITHDVTMWTDILSDKERTQISTIAYPRKVSRTVIMSHLLGMTCFHGLLYFCFFSFFFFVI